MPLWGAIGSKTVLIKRMLLGALGWYVVFTFLYFATVLSGIPYYIYNGPILWLLVERDFPLYPCDILFACIYLPNLISASVVGVVLAEGRKCSLKEIVTATLSWLWWIIAIAFVVDLWIDNIAFSTVFYALVQIMDWSYEDLLRYIMIAGAYES